MYGDIYCTAFTKLTYNFTLSAWFLVALKLCSLLTCCPVSLFPSYSVSLFPCYLVTLLPCYLVTLQKRYNKCPHTWSTYLRDHRETAFQACRRLIKESKQNNTNTKYNEQPRTAGVINNPVRSGLNLCLSSNFINFNPYLIREPMLMFTEWRNFFTGNFRVWGRRHWSPFIGLGHSASQRAMRKKNWNWKSKKK